MAFRDFYKYNGGSLPHEMLVFLHERSSTLSPEFSEFVSKQEESNGLTNVNDLIACSAEALLGEIKAEIRKAPFFALQIDERQDASSWEWQRSIMVQYVDNSGSIQDYFLGFHLHEEGGVLTLYVWKWPTMTAKKKKTCGTVLQWMGRVCARAKHADGKSEGDGPQHCLRQLLLTPSQHC